MSATSEAAKLSCDKYNAVCARGYMLWRAHVPFDVARVLVADRMQLPKETAGDAMRTMWQADD